MNGTDTFTEPGVISEEPNSFLSQDDTANELSKSQHDQCPSRRDFKRDSTLDCSNRQGWEPNLLTFGDYVKILFPDSANTSQTAGESGATGAS